MQFTCCSCAIFLFSTKQVNVSDKLSMARWLQQLASPMVHNGLEIPVLSSSMHSLHCNIEVGMTMKTICNGCAFCSVHALLCVVEQAYNLHVSLVSLHASLLFITLHDWPAMKQAG